MSSIPSKPERFILRSIVPILCSISFGLIYYQGDIFRQQHPAFEFVWSALVMALFYNLLRDVHPRDAKIGFGVLGFFTIMTTHSTQPAYILRDLFYIAGMGASVVLYRRYYVRNAAAATLMSAVTFAGLYGMVSVATTTCNVLLLKIFTVDHTLASFRQIVGTSAPFGLLIGFAVGAGFDLAERFPRALSAAGEEQEEEGEIHAGT